jgi:GPH family glycoside/pentoside/hexuronide:cation symporter
MSNQQPQLADGTGAAEGQHPLAPSVSQPQLVGYAAGNFGKNLLWSTADLTLLFLFTDVMAIDPAVAGWVILASLCINALLDPLMGGLADRVRSPLGRSAPLILIGAPLCGLAFAGLYALPAAGSSSPVTAMLLLFAFRAAFAIMDAPHNAVLATLAGSAAKRGALSSLRFVFSSVATMAVVAVIPALVAARGPSGAQQLATIAGVAGGLSAVVMTIAALAVGKADRPVAGWRLAPAPRGSQLALLGTPPVLLVLVITFGLNVGLPLFGKMIVYHATYVVADAPRANLMLMAMVIGQIAGLPVWMLTLRRLPPADALGLAILAVVAAATAMAFGGGHTASSDALLALCFGLGAGGVYTIIWVVVADCADAFASSSGITATGLIFALAIVSIKLGQGVGAVVSGELLASAGYVPRVSTHAEIGATITGIQTGGPVIAGLITIALIWTCRPLMTGAPGHNPPADSDSWYQPSPDAALDEPRDQQERRE